MKHLKYLAPSIFILGTASSSALDIVFSPAAGMDQRALDGFESAALYWESVLMDDVTVNIEIDFTALDPGVLGQAGSTTQSVTVVDYFNALNADVTTADDAVAVANLPNAGGGSLTFLTQTDTESNSLVVGTDRDRSGNNRVLDLNTSNAKALGLFVGGAADADASITFSSSFNWDFDQSDGVGSGLQDFVGVAIHEIGHSLGFTSGVDTVDYAIGAGIDLENFRVFSGLDMFRYSAEGELNLAAGEEAYFSIDGGATNLGHFSTGVDYGDGNQASHWRDGVGLGIMDPTANPAGQINEVSGLDLMAFDVIGWDVDVAAQAVPEPSVLGLLGIGGGLLLGRRRRN
ncbi:hypothetical protein Rhal01_02384 [Rubritalea halochordaticola]|uniref:PEP-CTERM sorting domain-containing protein n=1 Tax=Rubritalea halochordaticola TaxID=714537 RepID=A0ABP9V4D8_9BACT